MKISQKLSEHITNNAAVNTHCHHLPDSELKSFTLSDILRQSYVNWCGISFDETESGRKNYLDKVRFNSYFYWLEKALQDIYNIDKSLTAETWEMYEREISNSSREDNYHLNLLREKCNYSSIILDTYWEPGVDNGHPDLFKPTFRIDSFLYGYNEEVKDHDGNNPYTLYNWNIKDFNNLSEYISAVKDKIIEKKEAGCIALKCALAYDRGLDFKETDREKAENVFNNISALIETESRHFQDYLFYQICNIAAELDLPLQIHTGLGQLHDTNALQLREVIEKHPETKFVLFHGGYPWLQDVCALTHNFTNVYIDVCWLPIISTTAARRFLSEIIEVSTMDKITWGCDTWTSEESYGALLALRQVLRDVLMGKINSKYLNLSAAKVIADRIMFKNAEDLYGLTT